MITPNQEAILGLLTQADAGLWQQADEIEEGGLLTGLIESVNRGTAPRPVPCGLQELTVLREAGVVMDGDAPNTFILHEVGEAV